MNTSSLKEYFSFTRKERNAVMILLVLIAGFFLLPAVVPPASSGNDIRADSALPAAVAHMPAFRDSSGYYEQRYKERPYPYRYRYVPRRYEPKNYSPYFYPRHTEPAAKAYAHNRSVPVIAEVLINEADSSAFLPLPGIGMKLAARIVAFRDRLGGFYSVDQVAETYGLPDSTFQMIREKLKLGEREIVRININTADAGILKQHPYIRWNLANAIVEYRRQHGSFKEMKELLQIGVMTPEVYKKITPYLTTEEGSPGQ